MRVVEAPTGLTYNDAKAKCAEIDPISYLAEPYNEYLQKELKTIISNTNLTETNFWTGNRSVNLGLMEIKLITKSVEFYCNNNTSERIL